MKNVSIRVKNNDKFFIVIGSVEEKQITRDQTLDLIWNHLYDFKNDKYQDLDLVVNDDCLNNIMGNKMMER